MSTKCPTAAVVVVSPANSSFHSLDLFVIATLGQPGENVTIFGIQCTKGLVDKLLLSCAYIIMTTTYIALVLTDVITFKCMFT